METIIFAATAKTETHWDVTIDGTNVKISDDRMAELVHRFLRHHKVQVDTVALDALRPGWA